MRDDYQLPVFVFDLGGVLIKWRSNDPIYRYIAKRYGVSPTKLKGAMIANLPSVESGETSTGDFVAEGLARLGRRLRPGDSGEELWLRPFARSARLRLGTSRLVASLRRQGYPVYCLSNISPPHLAFVIDKGWADLFDVFFASCELGCVKPDPRIFQNVLDSVDASPDQVVFVDDNPICVEGAREFGIGRAVRFQSVPLLKREINEVMAVYKESAVIR